MRSWMEEKGWRQGSIIIGEDIKVFKDIGENVNPDTILIVASQSCDIANNSEPHIEFSIGKEVDCLDGNFTYNKNPRRLHLICNTNLSNQPQNLNIELFAHEKICVDKTKFSTQFEPNKNYQLLDKELSIYVDWLAGRYKRPALPTKFDERFDNAWKKDKRRKSSGKLSEDLIGIYIKIFPDEEIDEDQPYEVELLVLVTPEADHSRIKILMQQYVDAMKSANFILDSENPFHIRTEHQVSIGTLRQYKRFVLEDLSHKHDNHPLPCEIHLS